MGFQLAFPDPLAFREETSGVSVFQSSIVPSFSVSAADHKNGLNVGELELQLKVQETRFWFCWSVFLICSWIRSFSISVFQTMVLKLLRTSAGSDKTVRTPRQERQKGFYFENRK